MPNISIRLKEALKLRNINQAELARRAGVDKATVTKWLKSENGPNMRSLKAISEALNVSEGYLLGYLDDPRPLTRTEELDAYINRHSEGTAGLLIEDADEISVIENYRKSDPNVQMAVRLMIGMEK